MLCDLSITNRNILASVQKEHPVFQVFYVFLFGVCVIFIPATQVMEKRVREAMMGSVFIVPKLRGRVAELATLFTKFANFNRGIHLHTYNRVSAEAARNGV